MDRFENVAILDDVERLIVLRKRLGNKKQYQFARDIGCSGSYLAKIESYHAPFSNKLRKKINTYLASIDEGGGDYGKNMDIL